MKKLNLVALLLGAALFLGFGATTASAEMKCGAGKCGSAMMEKTGKSCGDKSCDTNKDCKCAQDCKCVSGKCKCGVEKAVKACSSCDDKKAPAKAMKCGAGKCGSK